MNSIKSIIFVFSLLSYTLAFSQSSDPVVIRINNKTEITKSDFEYAYKKDLSGSNEKQIPVDEFLQSYINLKLSVEEAKQQGLDKDRNFMDEYSSYIEQIEKPYITDTVSPVIFTENIYKRLEQNIEVSHILIKLPEGNLLPKDTVEAFKQISSIYKLATTKDGTSFENLATEYSQDSISKYSRIPGYIGWKTALASPYPFENTMYSLPIGAISEPVRSSMGYHLIKVHNERPDKGQILIAHILLSYPQQNPTQQEKDSVINLSNKLYNELLAGESFEKLCAEYSVDKQTIPNGGQLGWFGVNRPLPPALEPVLFGIENIGEVLPPMEAQYGYHIFKLIDKMPLLPYDTMKDNLIKAVTNSDRNEGLTQVKIDRLTQDYTYKVNEATYKELQRIANLYLLSDTTFFNRITPFDNKPILDVNNVTYKVKDFVFFLEKNPLSDYTLSTDILHYKFNDFILDKLIQAQRNDLFAKYPEFRHLAQEFHDGILYFNIMNNEVWGKAQSDHKALQALFDNNPQKYTWQNPRYKGYVIHAKSKEIMKEVQNFINQNSEANDLRPILNKTFNTDSTQDIIIEKGLWGKGENPYVDRLLYKVENNNEIVGYPEFIIEGKLISSPEDLNDAYGQVTAEYQSIIEKEWIEALRSKYKVEIDQKVLESIK